MPWTLGISTDCVGKVTQGHAVETRKGGKAESCRLLRNRCQLVFKESVSKKDTNSDFPKTLDEREVAEIESRPKGYSEKPKMKGKEKNGPLEGGTAKRKKSGNL